jgi:hypothetical protein
MTETRALAGPEMRIALPTQAYDKKCAAAAAKDVVEAWLTDQGAPAMLRQPIGRIDRACARDRSGTRQASWPRARRREHETLGLGR